MEQSFSARTRSGPGVPAHSRWTLAGGDSEEETDVEISENRVEG